MRIVCPNCNFASEIDSSTIPTGATRATCPKCRTRFGLFPEEKPESGMEGELDLVISSPHDPYEEAAAPPREQVSLPPLPGREARAVPPPLPPMAGVPWESSDAGFVVALWETIKMVLFKPGIFFKAMPTSGGLKPPLVFGLLTGSIGMFFSIFWYAVMAAAGLAVSGEGHVGVVLIGLGVAVVLMPLLVLIGLYVGAAVLHLFLMIVRGAGGGYEATFRVLAYSSAAQLFNVVPFVGGMAAGIWGLVLMIIGLPQAHRTGVGRVLAAVFGIPFILMFLLAILGVVAAIILGPA